MAATPSCIEIIDRMAAVHNRIGLILKEWRSSEPTMLEKDVELQGMIRELDEELDELRMLLREAK